MGVDIYLESIFKTFEPTPPTASENPIEFMTRNYAEMRATGGYFRNGYNSGDVMWAMGLSWSTVTSMLDEGRLPIASARALVEIIEARPLTRERVAAHIFEHMTGGVEPQHPLTGAMREAMEKAVVMAAGKPPPPLEPPDLDHLFGFLNTRRDELLAILRKSIELDEPLEIN